MAYQRLKMASVAMLIGGALANALAFTGSSYLFYLFIFLFGKADQR